MLVKWSTGRVLTNKQNIAGTVHYDFPAPHHSIQTGHRGDRPSSTFWKQAFRFSGAVCPVGTQCRNVHCAKLDTLCILLLAGITTARDICLSVSLGLHMYNKS